MPTEFRKRTTIHAQHWDGSRAGIEALCRWVNDGQEEPVLDYVFTTADDVYDVQIQTLEGILGVTPGDWVVRNVTGEFYLCKPDVFEATYEAVAPGA